LDETKKTKRPKKTGKKGEKRLKSVGGLIRDTGGGDERCRSGNQRASRGRKLRGSQRKRGVGRPLLWRRAVFLSNSCLAKKADLGKGECGEQVSRSSQTRAEEKRVEKSIRALKKEAGGGEPKGVCLRKVGRAEIKNRVIGVKEAVGVLEPRDLEGKNEGGWRDGYKTKRVRGGARYRGSRKDC